MKRSPSKEYFKVCLFFTFSLLHTIPQNPSIITKMTRGISLDDRPHADIFLKKNITKVTFPLQDYQEVKESTETQGRMHCFRGLKNPASLHNIHTLIMMSYHSLYWYQFDDNKTANTFGTHNSVASLETYRWPDFNVKADLSMKSTEGRTI